MRPCMIIASVYKIGPLFWKELPTATIWPMVTIENTAANKKNTYKIIKK